MSIIIIIIEISNRFYTGLYRFHTGFIQVSNRFQTGFIQVSCKLYRM